MAKVDLNILSKINQASASWKTKVLWWSLAAFGFIGIVGLSIFLLMQKKNPVKEVGRVVDMVEEQIRFSDANAKAKVAESLGVEKEVVKEIKRIAFLKDGTEKAKRMAELAKEDY